jgi:hypothetical protein
MSLSNILQDSLDRSSSSHSQLPLTLLCSSPCRPTLENLPAEIRGLLLQSLPDGPTLCALVHASPLYHASYLSQRHLILSSVLQNNIPPACLVTAYFVEEASKVPGLDYDDAELARISLVQRFFAQRSVSLAKERLQDTHLETTILIFQRHWRIWGVAFQYCCEKLFVNPVSKEAVQIYDPPSRDEIYPLCRALHHFELYCFLFVSSKLSKDGPYREQNVLLQSSEYGLSQRFLPILVRGKLKK